MVELAEELGAAMARTSLPFGVVTSPGQRYPPVITAQAIGTLAEMFPGRFVLRWDRASWSTSG